MTIDEKLPDRNAAKGFYSKYEPKEVLGKGGCSVVRRCIEKETGQEFAAKIIDLSDEKDSTVLEATKREIEILRAVAGHPYIIELHDVFESSTFFFLVFEICKNGELFDYLTSVVTLSEKRTKIIMNQLMDAIKHVHGQNIVHRDLKPENILLDDNYNVKLTDFGFAKVLQHGETITDVSGTPNYMAPEVLQCAMYEGSPGTSFPVDIWACGVIMYTLLVGCPPFWHRKQMVMIRNIMEGKYSLTSPEWTDVADEPKDLISRLLVIDPKQRITLEEVLTHPFFDTVAGGSIVVKPFNARAKLKETMLLVRCMVRIQRLKLTPKPLSLATARVDPYRIRVLRKVLDKCAYKVYGHWVKKGEGQDRAALFQNSPKMELHHYGHAQHLLTASA